jgi:hypothetical protein
MTPDEQVADALSVPGAVVEETTPEQVVALFDRAAWFRAMREALDWLEARPDLPIPGPYTQTAISVVAENDDFDIVHAVARQLGVEATISAGGSQCTAQRDFDRHIVYQVFSNTSERMARYNAEITYAGSVIP